MSALTSTRPYCCDCGENLSPWPWSRGHTICDPCSDKLRGIVAWDSPRRCELCNSFSPCPVCPTCLASVGDVGGGGA